MNWEAIFWLAAMIVFIFVEASSVALVSIWFAVGSLGAIVVALAGGSIGWQIGVFLGLAVLLVASLRPVVRRYIHPKVTATNVDSIVGATGIVTAPVDNISATGQVKIGGMEWSARSADGKPIDVGVTVRVDRIEGVKAFVTPVDQKEQAAV